MQVVLSPQAGGDLYSIKSYIGAHNPHAASRIAIQLIALCDRLEHLPERGRPGRAPDTREIASFWPYVIVYRVTGEVVEILRIHHGRQNW